MTSSSTLNKGLTMSSVCSSGGGANSSALSGSGGSSGSPGGTAASLVGLSPPTTPSSVAAMAAGTTANLTPSAAAASVEPLDYEEYVLQQRRLAGGAPVEPRAAHLVEFPRDDIEVKVVPRKIRTIPTCTT